MAVAFRSTHTISDGELVELSRLNPAYSFERGPAGELIVTPPAGAESGIRNIELARQLANWNLRAGHGTAADSSAGFTMPDSAVYSPDASWVRGGVWDTFSRDEREGFAPICPDLVFELVSRSDTPARLREKMRRYIACGARVAVLIDPYRRFVEIFKAGAAIELYDNVESIVISKEWLPGATEDFVLELEGILNG